jgi:hypothetical protein
MIVIKKVSIDPCAEVIAYIQCEGSVGLNEEDKIREMLRNFYAKEKRDFARVVVQIVGAVILFRTIANCKRRPTKEDIVLVLQAVNCFTPNAHSRPLPKKRLSTIPHRSTAAV